MKQKTKFISKKTKAAFSILKRRDIHHPMFIPLVAGIILFFLAIIIFIFFSATTVTYNSSRVVELYNGGKIEIIPTTATTVGDLIKRLKIVINPGDIVDPSQNTPILTNGFRINIYRVHPVTISENGQSKVILTADVNPRVIAVEAGYTIYPQDYVNDVTNPTELSQNIIGQVISIIPAIPVNLTLYGTQVTIRTHAVTVADFLDQNKIKTTNGSNVIPSLTTPITSGMQVLVVPVGEQLISEQQAIPYSTQNVNNPDLPYDTTTVAQQGVNGSELVVEQVSTVNGVTTNTPIQSVVINQPIPEIVDLGTGIASVDGGNNITWLRSSGINTSDYSYVNYIMNRESHWNPDDINSIGCIGIGQSCPSARTGIPSLALACPDWQTDAVCQLNFFNGYVVSHGYGDWANAAAHEQNYGWW
ncbi:MAG TPA: ubiquitin-like domain-containing protein [Candidatus Saccharimonadales bacterium]|nr:ubiquitin-like domain-containing protein [Candidatus Saccharimonadales bacterium]